MESVVGGAGGGLLILPHLASANGFGDETCRDALAATHLLLSLHHSALWHFSAASAASDLPRAPLWDCARDTYTPLLYK